MLQRCEDCAQRPQNKLLQVTWSWRRADGVRKAYRSRLCAPCFAIQVGPMSIDYTTAERLTCPGCGIDTDDDNDPIYTTTYGPFAEPLRTEAPFCAPCAAVRRSWILDHSRELVDQLGATGGPQQEVSAADVWRSLGIEPRSA